MDSFRLALTVVFPLIVYMIIGGIIRRMNVLALTNFKAMNEVIFKIFIPLALFMNVYDAKIGEVFRLDVVLLSFSGIMAVFIIAYFVIPKYVSDKKDASTIVQGIYRSNYVLYGTAVAAPMCTKIGMAMIGTLAALVVPLINALAVFLFETMLGRNVKLKEIFLRCIKNPLIEAGVLGFLFSAFHIHIPELIIKPLDTLGNIATPLALVILGGILSFHSIREHRMWLVIVTICRLILVPLSILSVAVAIGIRGEALIVLLAIFAAPTAVASAPMAQSMGGNGELAGEIVATTTVFSVITIFLFVLFLSALSFI